MTQIGKTKPRLHDTNGMTITRPKIAEITAHHFGTTPTRNPSTATAKNSAANPIGAAVQ